MARTIAPAPGVAAMPADKGRRIGIDAQCRFRFRTECYYTGYARGAGLTIGVVVCAGGSGVSRRLRSRPAWRSRRS